MFELDEIITSGSQESWDVACDAVLSRQAAYEYERKDPGSGVVTYIIRRDGAELGRWIISPKTALFTVLAKRFLRLLNGELTCSPMAAHATAEDSARYEEFRFLCWQIELEQDQATGDRAMGEVYKLIRQRESIGDQAANGEQPTRPYWFPKRLVTLKKWQRAYRIIVKLDKTYDRECNEDWTRDRPTPRLNEYSEALSDQMKWKPTEKTIGRIKDAGMRGWLT